MLRRSIILVVFSCLVSSNAAFAVEASAGLGEESVDTSQEIQAFQQLMDRVLDRVSEFNVAGSDSVIEVVEGHYSPPLDLAETDSSYIVKVDLPGMSKEQINIEFAEGSLIISGVRKKIQPKDTISNSIYKRNERSFGNFRRIVSLPNNIKTIGANAGYRQGVLEITIPKKASSSAKPVKLKVN